MRLRIRYHPQVFFIDGANMRSGVEPWSSGFTTILKGSGKPSTPPRVASLLVFTGYGLRNHVTEPDFR